METLPLGAEGILRGRGVRGLRCVPAHNELHPRIWLSLIHVLGHGAAMKGVVEGKTIEY